MSSDSFKVRKSLVIKPVSSPTLDEQGELAYDSVTDKLRIRSSASTGNVVEEAKTQTLTNKTLTSPNVNEAVTLTTTATKLNYLTSATGTTGTASSNIMFSASPTTTGTLGAAAATFSGLITSSVNGTGISLTPASGVSSAILDLTNTGGRSRVAIEGSSGGGILGSASAYDLSIVSATGRSVGIGVDDGAVTGIRIATSTGNVTMPHALTVSSSATISGSTESLRLNGTTPYMNFVLSGGANNYIGSADQLISGGANTDLGYRANNLHIFSVGSSEKLRIQSNALYLTNVPLATGRVDTASTATITALTSGTGFQKLTGSTATTIQGIVAGMDGQHLTVLNLTEQNMTIAHENGSATAANRITTMTGADVVTTGNGAAEFIYDTSTARWICLYVTA